MLLVPSRLIWISPVLVAPVVPLEESNNTRVNPLTKALSGLYQAHVENADPIVMEGIVKYCAPELDFGNPLVCAKFTTFCRSVKLPAMDVGLPVAVSDPVTPEASARNELGWNG